MTYVSSSMTLMFVSIDYLLLNLLDVGYFPYVLLFFNPLADSHERLSTQIASILYLFKDLSTGISCMVYARSDLLRLSGRLS